MGVGSPKACKTASFNRRAAQLDWRWGIDENSTMAKPTIEQQAAELVRMSPHAALLRREFDGLGGRSQVGKALRNLITNGVIVRVGLGIYAKARRSSLTGNSIPDAQLLSIGFDALRKLGIDAQESQAMRAYSSGKSRQMPMALAISVERPVGRKITFGPKSIVFERR